jgi:hypothetical protein
VACRSRKTSTGQRASGRGVRRAGRSGPARSRRDSAPARRTWKGMRHRNGVPPCGRSSEAAICRTAACGSVSCAQRARLLPHRRQPGGTPIEPAAPGPRPFSQRSRNAHPWLNHGPPQYAPRTGDRRNGTTRLQPRLDFARSEPKHVARQIGTPGSRPPCAAAGSSRSTTRRAPNLTRCEKTLGHATLSVAAGRMP